MIRAVRLTTVYAVFAALVVAAPLSASEEPPPVADTQVAQPEGAPAPQEPAAEEPAAEAPPAAEPAPAPEPAPALAPAPAEAPPAPPVPAQTQPRPPGDDVAGQAKRKAVAAASTTVTIKDFDFAPAAVTVNVGDTVTWSNAGPSAHSATANDGSFDTGVYGEGGSRSHTFDQAGTFSYICTPHPFMKGTVTVAGAASQGGDEPTSTEDPGSGSQDDGSTAGAETDSGPTLPSTGLDTGALLLLGLGTLVLGAWLRLVASVR